MSKFKVGDKVRCKRTSVTNPVLVAGAEYVVTGVYPKTGTYTEVGLLDVESEWDDTRFELVEPATTATTLTEDEQEFRRKIILTLLERGANVDQVVHMAQTIIDECRKRGA